MREQGKEPSFAQQEAGRAWANLKRKTQAERTSKVLAYLRTNPNSTSTQVFEATNASVSNAQKFTKRFRHYEHRQNVYSVDEAKVLRFCNS